MLANDLTALFRRSGISCILVDEARNATRDTILLVFEKYYMRVENRVSASVLIYPFKDGIKVEVIGSGGGQSVFFRFNWGSEISIARSMGKILLELGFTEVLY